MDSQNVMYTDQDWGEGVSLFYCNVTRVLQGSYKGVKGLLQHCYKDNTAALQSCYTDNTLLIKDI